MLTTFQKADSIQSCIEIHEELRIKLLFALNDKEVWDIARALNNQLKKIWEEKSRQKEWRFKTKKDYKHYFIDFLKFNEEQFNKLELDLDNLDLPYILYPKAVILFSEELINQKYSIEDIVRLASSRSSSNIMAVIRYHNILTSLDKELLNSDIAYMASRNKLGAQKLVLLTLCLPWMKSEDFSIKQIIQLFKARAYLAVILKNLVENYDEIKEMPVSKDEIISCYLKVSQVQLDEIGKHKGAIFELFKTLLLTQKQVKIHFKPQTHPMESKPKKRPLSSECSLTGKENEKIAISSNQVIQSTSQKTAEKQITSPSFFDHLKSSQYLPPELPDAQFSKNQHLTVFHTPESVTRSAASSYNRFCEPLAGWHFPLQESSLYASTTNTLDEFKREVAGYPTYKISSEQFERWKKMRFSYLEANLPQTYNPGFFTQYNSSLPSSFPRNVLQHSNFEPPSSSLDPKI